MRHSFVLMAASLGLLAACSEINETQFEKKTLGKDNLVERVIFEVPIVRSLGDDDETRASLSQQGDNAINFAWEATDTVGIYPDQGSQVFFSMANGVGTNVASFDGGGWALKQGATYSCYYPFIGNMYLKRNAIPVSFEHQVQRGVSNYEGINFLLASEGTSSSAGTLQFNFHMLNTVIRIKAIGLPAGTYTKLTLTVDEPLFVQDGSYSLENMSIVGNSYSNILEIALENFVLSEATTEANPVLIYLTSAPVNLAGKTVTIRAYSDNGSVYKCEKTPSKAYEAGAWGGLKCTMEKESFIIEFADPEVKRICVQNWDTDDDGELSSEEAIAVTDLGDAFKESSIGTFDELQYFIGLTDLNESFSNCENLTSIIIPSSVKRLFSPFRWCGSLKQLVIPAGVTEINTNPGTIVLETLIVDPLNPVYDSRENCNAIIETATNELIWGCINTVVPNGVTRIGNTAFMHTGITSIVIPEGVTSIGDGAFYSSALSSITLPNSLRIIEHWAFNSSALTSIVIPEGVISIGQEAFEYCRNLVSVTLPNSLRSIGDGAFDDCQDLSLTIPEGVESIGNTAFAFCSLKSLDIPSSVTEIGDRAFCYNNSIESITVHSGNTVYDSRNNCNALIETASNTLILGCSNTIIPEDVTRIAIDAFARAFYMKEGSIEIPSSVIEIGLGAFSGNNGLTSITVKALTPATLGQYAFDYTECPIYVPSESVEVYKNAPGWSAYSNRIFGSQSGVVEPIPGDEE